MQDRRSKKPATVRHSSSRKRAAFRVTVTRGRQGVRLPTTTIARILNRVAGVERLSGTLQVVVVGDGVMRQLNRRFRHRDRPTDVLAFPLVENGTNLATENLLGEVYCNCDHARRWQKDHGGTIAAELVRLAVHGCLHLVGYDHHTAADRRIMAAREDRYLADAGLINQRHTLTARSNHRLSHD